MGSGDAGDGGLDGKGSRLLIDTRVRKGPYWHLSQEAGAWCYQVYNKIYHPRAYIKPEDGGLIEKCKYVILCNSAGGILNDPILLRPYENEWWFSLADSDIGMYLQGVNHDGRWDCEINEIDVAPVQIQGPKAPALMKDVFGERVTKMKYYDMIHAEIEGCPVVISASGFSTELGYEIYLCDATKNAEKMWNKMLDAGLKHNLKVIAPGHHRRIEAGILSYGQVDLTKDAFVG